MNTDGADESSWELDPEDESGAVIATVGRQLKMWREAAGLDRAKFGERMGYGANLIYKIERGARIPRPEFLDKADEVLGAGGKIAAMKADVERARYPKKVRDLAKLESEAVELGAYGNHNLHGLLQTEEYARALYEMRRPAYSPDEVERLLDVGRLRNVEIQVMPTDSEDHAGMGGHLQVVKLRDGSAVGYVEAQLPSRLITNASDIQLLELRYGIIRSQALSPRESRTFIEKALGET